MYSVSAAYQTAIKQPIVQSRISFQIGNTRYSEDYVLKGSFHVENQCTDTSDVKLGAVYIAEMSGTFLNVPIARNQWRGTEITPYFELLIDEENDTWEEVPLGIFTVTEATYTRSGVDVKAYDNMRRLDKNMSLNQSAGYIWDFLVVAATACQITLAQTEQEIKALPNGNIIFDYYSENDVETWRDLVSWCVQTLGGYATVNREGKLEVRTFGSTITDTLTQQNRHSGGSFSDYITRYTGLSYVDLKDQKTIYTGATVDDGTTMNLGSNPFLQTRSIAEVAIANLLVAVALISYTPFKIGTVSNPAYDLGDLIKFTGGLAGTESIGCIMKYDFGFHKKYEMSGYGANPDAATARSKVDKDISGLLQNVSGDVMEFYELRNVMAFNIAKNTERQILRLKLASVATTRVSIHMNINLETEADVSADATIVQCKYLIDGDEMVLHPEESYIDGKHVLHLMYILPLSENVTTYFRLYMKAVDGKIKIDRGGAWLYASGYGIVGDGTWDGTFDLEDETHEYEIVEVGFADASDTVAIVTQTPVGDSVNDTVQGYLISDVDFADDVTDTVRITMRNTAFERCTEDESDNRIIEDVDGLGEYEVRYTEEEIS